MQSNQYWVLVKFKDEPGAGFARQYVTASNQHEATQMARAIYGRLLLTEYATPVPVAPQF
jgi:hypothetical protein